ncbi:hypothetical protein P5G51_004685 [Virgibacillus sp. 179-BFC.A HS]|uniref:Phosphotriesterase-related protein n=1 Tax=Tigheibacillus jepli TaxID=3035914 RepID=A0ABU5CEP9_9BACI|nr:hypothetical protein [Virgibacillus sp. 179-BFC.A HS]MDY0404788.1 hypothetical protein [Virgibacillus sp. 179-BFC.A HS]
MRRTGITEESIDKILVKNPRTFMEG